MQEKIRTIHVYFEEEEVETSPIIEADPPKQNINRIAACYLWFISCLFTLIPVCAIILANILPPYDVVLTKTLTVTLSLHPTTSQGRLYALPQIIKTDQTTVPATGSVHEAATTAIGVIAFFNGLFTSQTIPAGTRLTGKDGITVVTQQPAVIPAASPTTPPTYGTVSVTSYSSIFGASGNIAAHDIDQACCGPSILAENLDSFSGGRNAQDVTVVKPSDIRNAANTLKEQLSQAANDQVEREKANEQQLFPLSCTNTTSASKQAGDQAQTVSVTVVTTCIPFAFSLGEVKKLAESKLSALIPHSDKLIRTSFLVVSATLSNTKLGTGTVTLFVTAYLATIRPVSARFLPR
ncbi:MAG TPA: hypothetical protein VFV38_14730 [Ktedonobacteraceae bacterium]|nr:hypothetical protein [Ktedonobacteraceae bacterium]